MSLTGSEVLKLVVVPVLVGLIVAWLGGILDWLVPPRERAWLALGNLWSEKSQRPEDGFRVVLCWLENDRSGDDTDNVELGFSGVDGIDLVRSARIVPAASGAGEDWREEMRQSVRVVSDEWNADLVVVGLVKKPGEVLSLWFVPRSGKGTLERGDHPYRLEDVTLGKDFHIDLRTQLTTLALTAVAPLADNEVRGQVLEKGLWDATARLSILLKSATIDNAEHRADLHVAFGNALQALGERESGTERLENAVEAYREALKVFDVGRAPRRYRDIAQNSLEHALRVLHERRVEPG